jgi:polymorphic membrane protein
MRGSLALALSFLVCLGCGSASTSSSMSGSTGGTTGNSTGDGGGPASGGSDGTASTGSGGATGVAGQASGGATGAGGGTGDATGGSGGHASGVSMGTGGQASGGSTGGTTTRDAGTTSADAGSIGQAGNANGSCKAGVPENGQPADISNPTVVGSGTPQSCTFAALNAAVAKAGVITFNCGSGAVTIPITATMKLSISKNTVIDGGDKVTLDGAHRVQIFKYNSGNFQALETRVTLQHLALVNGKTTPTDMIPPAPTGEPACSQGYDDGEGGALYMRDGNLTVIDCIFDGNQSAPLGPDTGGGAIYMLGSKHGAVIVGSTFTNNSGANGGAVGSLYAELDIYNSLFENNKATGHDANNDDTTMKMCTVMNNGQYEIGSGGNGGAIYGDGNNFDITLCGDSVLNNAAGTKAFGGGLFFTSDNFAGILTITDTTMNGNAGGHWTAAHQGSVTNAGTAVGVNALSITITNSTLQGM